MVRREVAMPGTAAKGVAAGGIAGLASGMSALGLMSAGKPTIPKIIHQVANGPPFKTNLP